MSRQATEIALSTEERETLEQWVRGPRTEQRLAMRVRIIVAAGAGEASRAIARQEGVRLGTVSKWRQRFARSRLAGLADAPRPGPRRRDDAATQQRILATLDEPPSPVAWTRSRTSRRGSGRRGTCACPPARRSGASVTSTSATGQRPCSLPSTGSAEPCWGSTRPDAGGAASLR